ncbi:EAL domain-containing protein [Temperatibacter marinus]|uniref:EAL domain-containing protein n=1 Tax=Temperatibacter marinus TaxID=1456591 RepID=A0AA52EEE1_9PROT|nr:EAL domain-containing protein [Temperatibacter marinus]WND03256.1 EAL domain-containing protein [Temperatibacter marinus]
MVDDQKSMITRFIDKVRESSQPGYVISLRRQITLMFLVLFAIVQIALITVNYFTSRTTVISRISNDLDHSVSSFDRIISDQKDHLYLQADLLSKDFGFIEAFATNDTRTTKSALKNIKARGDTDIALAIDLDGKVIAQVSEGEDLDIMAQLTMDELIEMAEAEKALPYFMVSGDRLYELAVAPIKAPILTGVMIFAITLNDDQAELIKSFSSKDLDVAFVHSIDDKWQVSGNTNGPEFINFFVSDAVSKENLGSRDRIRFQNDEYMVRFLPLTGVGFDTQQYLLLSTSLDLAMEEYLLLFIALVGVGFLGLISLFVGSYLLSDRISAPITRFASAAAKVAQGKYAPLEVSDSYREVNNLGQSFNHMIKAVKEREKQITHQASHDQDTGLPNGQYMDQVMQGYLQQNKSFALVIAEIQNFHDLRVVLPHGHLTTLMQSAGHRLEKLTGVEVARLSTDTFGFLIPNADMAKTLMRGVVDGFLAPISLDDRKVDLNLLLGMAIAPDDGTVTNDLMLNAHSALDFARTSGESFVICNEEHKNSQEKYLSLMSDLREELSQGHVKFAFQPKLNLQTGDVFGAEALIRWISPKHGFVPPDEFITMAEQTGDIKHLTSWALGQIIEQVGKWKKEFPEFLVAVNLSTRDLQNENLPDLLRMITREFEVAPERICLEVTESAVMGDMKRALKILNELADMGFYLSIDDYGTGYSSLAYIKKLPVHELKIDKAFVLNLATSPEDQILVQSTIDLAHNLGMKVTAEGVEDEQSLALLKQYGCDCAQGYFISRPVFVSEFEDFCRDQK